MQNRSQKFWRLLLMVGALALLLALAASLSTLEIRPIWGDTFRGATGSPFGLWLWLGKVVVALGLIFTVTLLVISLLPGPQRRRPMPRMRSSLLSLILTFFLLALLRPEILKALTALQPAPTPATAAAATPAPAAVAPSAPPEGLLYVFSAAVAVIVVLVMWRLWKVVRRPVASEQTPARTQLAQTARAALQELQAGAEVQGVIARCYREMSQIVAEKRKVSREAYMTPREFVQYMEKAGVPRRPAEQLTALFEVARYSAQKLDAQAEASAVTCLRTLAEALEE